VTDVGKGELYVEEDADKQYKFRTFLDIIAKIVSPEKNPLDRARELSNTVVFRTFFRKEPNFPNAASRFYGFKLIG
jgi:hypothetical protein